MGIAFRSLSTALGPGRVTPRFRGKPWRPPALFLGGLMAASLCGPDAVTTRAEPSPAAVATPAASSPPLHPISRALRALADCRARYAEVRDYTCTFRKRERIDGRLSPPHVMDMKVRAEPASVYFRFRTPYQGREAIYVSGRDGGKMVAHDVGIAKLLAGTMRLDPRGSMAMEECRHPITEAGLGVLIETVSRHWAVELTPEESQVSVTQGLQIEGEPCTVIEAVHPTRQPHFLFHKVRLAISDAHGLPTRFEGYDWPERPGLPCDLVEEYTYLDVRFDVGLSQRDFDPDNPSYTFGRF